MLQLFLMIFLTAFSAVSAETCAEKNIPLYGPFDVDLFLGRWYGIEAYLSNNEYIDCLRDNYTLINSSLVHIHSEMKLQYNGTTISLEGSISPATSSGWTGDLNVVLSPNVPPPQKIIALDYTRYYLAYSCNDQESGTTSEIVALMARDKTLSSELRAEVDAIYSKYNLTGPFYTYIQSDSFCGY